MQGNFKSNTLFLILLAAFVLPLFFLSAQTPAEERESLEKELAELEEQIEAYEEDLQKTAQEKATLQNKINALRSKVRQLDLQIYQSNLIVADLELQIKDTASSIEQTILNIGDGQEQLAGILRLVYEEDQKHILEILLSEEDLSGFFRNLAALEELSLKNQEILNYIKSLKVNLEDQKEQLGSEKGDLEHHIVIQTLQKQEELRVKEEQEQVLKLTEQEYQKSLEAKTEIEKKAQAIRSRIFELIGVPEAPTFGEAYEIAKMVSGLTSVRPAFLLAVMYQESNIGKNVGQCYLKNETNGNGVSVNGNFVYKVMKPTRDIQPFLQITRELGRDPFNTPISCPIPSIGGYGGAMGPAQFIPSTWMIFKDRIEDFKGGLADPWNINDAFLAAATYLGERGAKKQTYEYEWCAAVSYFSGNCSLRNQVRYEFYGDNVMYWTNRFQQDINALEG